MNLDGVVNIIKLWPDSLYTLALTGLGALLGILIGLNAHERRERINREMQMRRDVYFQAAEAVANAVAHIGKFGDVYCSTEKHQELIKDYSARTAKVLVIGEIKLIHSLEAFHEKYEKAAWKLYPLRHDLMARKTHIDFLYRKRTDWQNIRDELLKRPSQAPSADIRIIEQFQNDIFKEIKKLESEFQENVLSVNKQIIEIIQELVPTEIELVLATRAELGFNLDEKAYRDLITDSSDRVFKNVQTGFQEMTTKLPVASEAK
jgi:hypothetical protein